MRVIPSVLFSIIAYFMTGLQRSAGQFFIFLITIFVASIVGSSVGFFMSATIGSFGKYSNEMLLCMSQIKRISL